MEYIVPESYKAHIRRFNKNGKCCQPHQLQLVAANNDMVFAWCVVCGKTGNEAKTWNLALDSYYKKYPI